MKSHAIFLNIIAHSILSTLFISCGFAQDSSTALNLPKINFKLKPSIECVNFPQKDSVKAAKLATRYQRFVKVKFDSVSQVKKGLSYTVDSTKRADFQCELILALGNYSFSQSFPNFVNLHYRVVNLATLDTVTKSAIALEELSEIDPQQFQSSSEMFSSNIFISFHNMIVTTDEVLNPYNTPQYPNQGAAIIPQYFVATQPHLTTWAKKITHLVNNVLAQQQTKKKIDMWQPTNELVYHFNYYPRYRMASPKTYQPNNQDFLITGEVYEKSPTQLALKLAITGQELYEDSQTQGLPVQKELVFRKDLLDRGIYSELVYKIQKNFLVFVLANYR